MASTASFTFVKPNVRSQPRSDRIAEEVWENYRADIIRENKSGGDAGIAHAHRWIKAQNIAGFDPSDKQLRHRINKVWKKEAAPKSDTTGDSNALNSSVTNADLEPGENSKITRDEPETNSSEEVLQGSPYQSTLRLLPRTSSRPTSRPRRILESLNVSTVREMSDKITQMISSDTMPPSTAPVSIGTKRRAQSLDWNVGRLLKRQNEGDKSVYMQPASGTIHPLIEPEPAANNDIFELEDHVGAPPIESSDRDAASVNDATSDAIDLLNLVSKEEINDPVLKPVRLQSKLKTIGIEWDIDMVSRCLRKDVIFQTSTPPVRMILQAEAYTVKHIERVKAAAELLLASSVPDQAFPLFLYVWTRQRGNANYGGARALMQCVRTAVRRDDKTLIRCVLAQKISSCDRQKTPYDLSEILECLELSRIFHEQGYEGASKSYEQQARMACPTVLGLMEIFQDAGQHLRGRIGYDVSAVLIGSAFPATPSTDPLAESLRFVLNDVLLATIHLDRRQYHAGAFAGTRHLRNCLERVLTILLDPIAYGLSCQWMAWHRSGQSRKAERAIFLDLVNNWMRNWVHRLYPSIESENLYIGISTLQILSVVAFLAMNPSETLNYFGMHPESFLSHSAVNGSEPTDKIRVDIVRMVGAILASPDRISIMGFLWCSIWLRKVRGPEGSLNFPYHGSLLPDSFTKFSLLQKEEAVPSDQRHARVRESEMTEASVNPTITSSLDTSSTWLGPRCVGIKESHTHPP